ncbi:MAG: GNAT family N-acetyltransferase, partial [Sciscionella sp.]
FVPPRGLFLLGYLDGAAAACGGWRAHGEQDAEMKRMYVVPVARGLGLARTMLAELEATASAAGHTRMMLETGMAQPEAIGLYTSSGYHAIEKYGMYRCEPGSRCYAKRLGENRSESIGRLRLGRR